MRSGPILRVVLVVLAMAALVAVDADFGEAVMHEAVAEAGAADEQEEQPQTMESLLHWAIAHSDHEELARRADGAREEGMLQHLSQQLEERRARVRELRQYMDEQVTETQLIQGTLAVLNSSNATASQRLRALEELQPLVEPIDNANDLRPLGGMQPLVQHLFSSPSSRPALEASEAEVDQLRAAAAYVLGTAASNNVKFQADLLSDVPDIFDRLLQLSLAAEEVSIKALYALAAMVRNLPRAHQAFSTAGGYSVLERVMSGPAVGARLKRKAVSLVMDLSLLDLPAAEQGPGGRALATQAGLLSATLQLLEEDDPDMVEKALGVMKALLLGQDRAEATASFKQAGAGKRLASLHARLVLQHEAEAQEATGAQGDEDPYLKYLVQVTEKVQQLLEHGLQQAGVTGQQGNRREGSPTPGGHSSEEGQGQEEQVIMQLGHAEL